MEANTKKIAEEAAKLSEPEVRELISLLGKKFKIKILEKHITKKTSSKWSSVVNDLENDDFYQSKNVSDFCNEVKETHEDLNNNLYPE